MQPSFGFIRDFACDGLLAAQAVRHGVTSLAAVQAVMESVMLRDRERLWTIFVHGRFVFRALPHGAELINPLVMAVRANYVEDEVDCCLPDTVQTLLFAHCEPNDFCSPEVSPLRDAIRSGDCRAVAHLLRFRANPNRSEDSQNAPIFTAIDV